MKPSVVAFAGAIGSGKSTLSLAVAHTLGWSHVRFGDYVRAEAKRRSLPEERLVLQELGAELVADGLEAFCREILHYAHWKSGSPLVVDGVRHAEIIPILQRLVAPLEVRLVYLEVDDQTRLERITKREMGTHPDLTVVEQHSTEEQVREVLPALAQLQLDGRLAPDILVNEVVKWISSLHESP